MAIASFPKAPQLHSLFIRDTRNYLFEPDFFVWVSQHTSRHVFQGDNSFFFLSLFLHLPLSHTHTAPDIGPLHRPVKERDFSAEVELKKTDHGINFRAGPFPPLSSEVGAACLREFHDLWMAKKLDEADSLADSFFANLNSAKSSEKLFWISLEMLRYSGKNEKAVQSSSFLKNSMQLKSAFPKWSPLVGVVW